MADDSTFTLKEKYAFWRKKWLREHISSIVIITVIIILAFVCIAFYNDDYWICSFMPIAFVVEYMLFRNRMMVYIENKVYGSN